MPRNCVLAPHLQEVTRSLHLVIPREVDNIQEEGSTRCTRKLTSKQAHFRFC